MNQQGLNPDEITDVVLTHLHFDHCGGCYTNDEKNKTIPVFPNAKYHISLSQWETALNPGERESPSFLEPILAALKDSGKLKLIEHETELFPNFFVKLFNGHTKGQLIPFIKYRGKTVVFCADLFPTTLHLQMPCIMAYDTRPLQTTLDKKRFFYELEIDSTVLFFEHDQFTECCTLAVGQKGIQVNNTFKINELHKNLF